jgi:UDP-N-acetylglucosamine--N-acetylmuramyl-(pentapeptide) pyrophosphoryl-undecaprenol N-acetylglucosamine transferase
VRPEFVGGDREAGLRRWDLAPDVPTLLMFGGSQGARRLNQLVLDSLESLDGAATSGRLQLLWICGERNHDEIRERLEHVAPRNLVVRLVPFVREMGLAYAVADLALCRAGAMTLAELTANALPAILVPLPGATANHQWLNAKPLGDAGAAVVIEEHELDGQRLAKHVIALLSDRAELERMRNISGRLGRPQAVAEIVAMIVELRGELP